MRWQSSGQSCISPSMAFPLVLVLSRCSAPQMYYTQTVPAWLHPWQRPLAPETCTRLPACEGRATRESWASACRLRSAKSPQREPADVMACCAGGREVCQHFADHRRELEPVPRTWRGDNDVAGAGQMIDEKVTVGGHGVETGRGGDDLPICHWEMLRNGAADQCLVARRHGSIVRVRIDSFVAVVMLGDLDCRAPARAVRRRDAVMHAMPAFDNEHRELTRRR